MNNASSVRGACSVQELESENAAFFWACWCYFVLSVGDRSFKIIAPTCLEFAARQFAESSNPLWL